MVVITDICCHYEQWSGSWHLFLTKKGLERKACREVTDAATPSSSITSSSVIKPLGSGCIQSERSLRWQLAILLGGAALVHLLGTCTLIMSCSWFTLDLIVFLLNLITRLMEEGAKVNCCVASKTKTPLLLCPPMPWWWTDFVGIEQLKLGCSLVALSKPLEDSSKWHTDRSQVFNVLHLSRE